MQGVSQATCIPSIDLADDQLSVTFRDPTANALQQLLQLLIIPNANTSYHPDKYKDMDLAEFTRQTMVFKGLWDIYLNLPTVNEASMAERVERNLLHDAINDVQKILFPWISERTEIQPGTESVFSLFDSFQEEAGIVIATGTKGFRWTLHQVSALRNVLNCTLPIEM